MFIYFTMKRCCPENRLPSLVVFYYSGQASSYITFIYLFSNIIIVKKNIMCFSLASSMSSLSGCGDISETSEELITPPAVKDPFVSFSGMFSQ